MRGGKDVKNKKGGGGQPQEVLAWEGGLWSEGGGVADERRVILISQEALRYSKEEAIGGGSKVKQEVTNFARAKKH